MHADERHPIGGGRGRQYSKELLVAVTGERGDDHGVEAGIGGLTRARIRVGVDPEDRQVIAMPVDQYEGGAMLTEHSSGRASVGRSGYTAGPAAPAE